MITTKEKPVVVESRHFAVDAIPMISVDIDLSDPFIEVPDWAQNGKPVDVQLRVKLLESDRERLETKDWRELFPTARSIDVVPKVEPVVSVRCEEVRQAKTLREKVLAWAESSGTEIPERILAKADLLETLEPENNGVTKM